MRAVIDCLNPRSFARAFALLTVGLVAANCSSDTARFNDNPFASSARPVPSETTGSAPSGQVETQPLPDPQALPVPPAPGRLSAVGSRPSAGELTGAVPQLRADPKPKSGWTWEGGTPVTIAAGDTLASLGRRYGVPASAIAEANGLTGPAALRPGQRIVIPRYNAATASASDKLHAPMSSVHVVAPGETLVAIARRYGRPVAEIASANKISQHAMVKLGDRLVIPGKSASGPRTASAPAPEVQPKPAVVAAPTPAPAAAAAPQPRTAENSSPQKLASLDPTPAVRVATPTVDPEETASSRGGSLAFRWPVKGRVIANFGSKTNGQQNDGINLAVPEGTAVRAAEDGVVAYAGSELKGYGNLILVRHSNGYVTAYAHASEIMVKRNDPVRRGQVIAKSGQTGTVTSPQLHFEIRKGSSPVDPMPHLPSGA